MRLAGLIALGLLAATLPTRVASAQEAQADEQEETYRGLIRDAVEQSRTGHLQESLALFLRAHAMRPSARTLRGIGLVRFGLADYAGTIRALEASLADERRPLDDDDRAEATEILERARRFVARVELRLSPENARVSSDGRPLDPGQDGAILLNPGRHELRIEAEGLLPQTRTIEVEGGATSELEVTLAGAPAPSREETGVRLRVLSRPPGLLLHAMPMSGPGELVPNAVAEVCIAPCEAHLDPGLYRLAIGRPAQTPTPIDDYRIDEPLGLTMHFEDRDALRTAGWATGGGGIGVSLILLATLAAVDSPTPKVVLGVISAGIFTAGLSVAFPLVFWNDATAIELRPLGAVD